MHYAVRNNHRHFVQEFIKDKGNASQLNQKTNEEGDTPLFYALKFIKDQVDKKLMVKTLIALGADPKIRNNKDLRAHQAYTYNYGMDEAALYVEKAIHFDINKKKINEIGSFFEVNEDMSKENASEIKNLILHKWEDFVKDKPLGERLQEDLEVAMDKKQKIIDKFLEVQNSQPLDAHKQYNDSEEIRFQLKQKMMEIAGRDIIKSFEKYH